MSLLKTTALTKTFAGLTAVDSVDLEVAPGEIHALIGPNGAGKSTLVGMVAGRIEATRGQVHFKGQDITAMPAHGRIDLGMAYTFQITSVYARLSLEDNMALALGVPDPVRARAGLDRVGLSEALDQPAGELSYGHQRLLEIAMGVAQSPDLLILDEPTQGLAESEIQGFNRLIRELAGDTTILLIEHNMNVVMELAQRITVLDMGRVLASGLPGEIRDNVQVQDAYLGGSHAEA